ncbi:MAG TPA: hypothetical protein VMU66_00465 [Gaiellales bacterium]|nr:hypothetical protein [Gaiellales bacterium]
MLREIAEYPNAFSPLGPHDERIETDRFTLCMGAGRRWNTVQRQRIPRGQVDDAVEEVRSLLRARGRTSTQWEVGSSAEPTDLVELLLRRGLVRDPEPHAAALVLTASPPPAPLGLVARRVETFADYAAAVAVQDEAFETPEHERRENLAALPERWRDTPNLMHAVWLDDALVCAGGSAPTDHGLLLYGGATHPQARGRGAYRALIAARWDEAVRRGTPALLTQAGRMSRPILERLGFDAVGHVAALLDDFGEAPA